MNVFFLIPMMACRSRSPVVLKTDLDGDGFGVEEGDCDDSNPDIYPQSDEHCDGLDNDCSGVVDDNPIDGTIWYEDLDGDGVGGSTSILACTQPDGYSSLGEDCNDVDAAISPEAFERCGDGIDQNCDGADDGEHCTLLPSSATIKIASTAAAPMGVGGAFFDYNGDGLLDLVSNGSAQAVGASLFVFEGPLQNDITSEEASFRIGLSSLDRGGAVVHATDINTDGKDDLIVASYQSDQNLPSAGVISILLGPIESSNTVEEEADIIFLGTGEGDFAGYSFDTLEDINGDGTVDLVVGAHEHRDLVAEGGAVYFIFDVSSWSGTHLLSQADLILYGGADENLGFEVSSAGDLNGDGLLDVAINAYRYDSGARNAGRTFVFFGPLDSSLTLEAADVYLDGRYETEQQGSTLSALSDIDGDGLDDLALASQFADIAQEEDIQNEGCAYIVTQVSQGEHSLEDIGAKIVGTHSLESFGREIRSLRDINEDGFGDVVISSKRYSGEVPEQGRSSVFLGPIEGSYDSDQAHLLLYGGEEQAWLGISMDVGFPADTSQLLLGGRDFAGDSVLGTMYLFDIQPLLLAHLLRFLFENCRQKITTRS